MEEKCEIELTEGYHSINSRDVRLHIHKGISGVPFAPGPRQDPDGEIENSGKSIFEIRISNFCDIQVIVFDLKLSKAQRYSPSYKIVGIRQLAIGSFITW